MAKNVLVGVNNIAKKPRNIYVGVDGKARRVKEVYAGVDGIAKKVWPSSVLPNRYTQLEYLDMGIFIDINDGIAQLNPRIITEFTLFVRKSRDGIVILSGDFRNTNSPETYATYSFTVPSTTTSIDSSPFRLQVHRSVIGTEQWESFVFDTNASEGILLDTVYRIDFYNGNNAYLYNTEGYYSIVSHNYLCSAPKHSVSSVNRDTLRLFGSKTNPSVGKAFYIKIYNGATPIRDLYPCYRDSDHYLGYFDIVNQIFYQGRPGGSYDQQITYEDAISRNFVVGPIV